MEIDIINWRMEKILTLEQAAQKATELKAAGKKIITVNGSFDILHAGHLDQLEEAKKQGDVLFVGINSDTSVREEKGEERPYVPEKARAALLAALTCVDYVIIIDAPYDGTLPNSVPRTLLKTVKPAVHVNGPDRGAPETWTEWPAMQELGIEGYTVPRRNDFSTSEIIKKLRG